MKNEQVDQQIEDTLNSLDGMSGAGAPPYFYSKLAARMQAHRPSAWHAFLQLVTRPVVSVSILSIFLALNIMAIKNLLANDPSRSASLQSFATEYNLTTNVVYANTGK